ncbi:hypothetical protein D9M68_884840 [compost metagenome]
MAAASMSALISPSFACVSWKSPRVWPNILRVLAWVTASANARRAIPSAAAATEARKMSSVRMASLKPPLTGPSKASVPTAQLLNARVASGCGAITWMCALLSRPGVPASTMKALMPRAPAPGSVLANTT